MLFPTLQFALFFGLTVLLHRSVPMRARSGMLLGASLIFYGLWIPPYLLLLLGEIGVNYVFLLGIRRGRRPKLWLAASVVFTLGVLASFKYTIPILRGAIAWLGLAGAESPALPEILLPLGISFFSFQILGFAIDAYRRELPGLPITPARYALFIAFFPQLVAGPILRAGELLPQLARGPLTNRARDWVGIRLFTWGLVKKVLLSDFLLAPYVDRIFLAPGTGSIESHWLAIYSFAFQIYCDFSGYTDMARGLACILGYDLPENFREPYLSRGPSEFWRRWHITLSRWLRDYLYIPLGGNRSGSGRTYVNLGLTMLLGGLWHGAGWTFVLWGAFHGAMLAVERAMGWRFGAAGDRLKAADWPKIFVFFHLTCLSWVLFRAENLGDALDFYSGLFGASGSIGWPLVPLLAVVFCAALHLAERWVRTFASPQSETGSRLQPLEVIEAAAVGVALAAVVAVGGSGAEFIYFQF